MKLLNIAAIITLITVVDHSSSSSVLATTTTTTSEYEPEQEEDGAGVVVPLVPTLLRGAKKAVYQFLSDGDGDGDSEELSCVANGAVCYDGDNCCDNWMGTHYVCGCHYPLPVCVPDN